MSVVELDLDICTPEGKTWLAEITGVGGRFGVQRSFVNPVQKTTSKSGKTGTATYVLSDGVFESNEGRHRLGRRFWVVRDGAVREVDRAEALKVVSQ